MTSTKPLEVRWGETIRDLRTEQGLSLQALADMSGLDPGHISRAERGLAGLGDQSRMAIARALGRRVEQIFTYPEVQCRSAAPATAAAPTPTRATGETRSPAPSAAAQGASDRTASRASRDGGR